jgi:hypothetical protein
MTVGKKPERFSKTFQVWDLLTNTCDLHTPTRGADSNVIKLRENGSPLTPYVSGIVYPPIV